MKLKDIKLGDQYVVGTTTGRYGNSRALVTVVAVRVYGSSHKSGTFRTSETTNPTYVEVELVDPQPEGYSASALPISAAVKVMTEDWRRTGRSQYPRYRKGRVYDPIGGHDPDAPTRKALRVPAGRILGTWATHQELAREVKEQEKRAKEYKAEQTKLRDAERARMLAARAKVAAALGLDDGQIGAAFESIQGRHALKMDINVMELLATTLEDWHP